MPSASGLKSSSTLTVGNRPPTTAHRLMESADQISLARTGTVSGAFTRASRRRLPLRFRFSHSALYARLQAAFAKALAPNRRVQLVEAVGRVHRGVALEGHDHGPVLAWSGRHVAPLSQQVHHRIGCRLWLLKS